MVSPQKVQLPFSKFLKLLLHFHPDRNNPESINMQIIFISKVYSQFIKTVVTKQLVVTVIILAVRDSCLMQFQWK